MLMRTVVRKCKIFSLDVKISTFFVDSAFGITITTWLAIIVYSTPDIGLSIRGIVILFTEVFSVAYEFTIIELKELKIDAPPPTAI